MSSSSTSPRSGEKRARLPKMRSGNKSAAYDETNEVVYLIERRSLARDLLHTLQTVAGADRVAGGPTSLSGMPSGADNCFDIVLWRLPTSKALTKTRPSPTARARDYQAWITRVVTNDAAATVSIVVEHRTTERHNKQWERVAMDINYDILLERSPMLARLVTQIPKGRGKDTRACAKRARACGQKGGASAAVGLLHRLYDKSLATGPARRREFELDLGTELEEDFIGGNPIVSIAKLITFATAVVARSVLTKTSTTPGLWRAWTTRSAFAAAFVRLPETLPGAWT